MFTQFFGNYLLNQRLVSPEHLSEALKAQKTTRLKLGVLAINAGLMTAADVDKVHAEQQRVDMRIGDLMVKMGYLTEAQIETLLKSQKSGHLLLGQALVDRGHMTTAQFEQALKSYKEENSISDADFFDVKTDKVVSVINNFYHFYRLADSEYYLGYVSLLFKNLIRFIGDDFTPLEAKKAAFYNCEYSAVQQIDGEFTAVTAIDCSETAFVGFASRYANENLVTPDEYTNACVGEFLNLHNGLYTVNISNDMGIELTISPQVVSVGGEIVTERPAYIIPICFPFGTVNFIVGSNRK